jgi:hypothetical protein
VTVASARPAVLGHTVARIFTPPQVAGKRGPCGCGCALTRKTSYGFDVDDFARDVLGRPLDPWQRWLVIHAGEIRRGRPRFRQVLVLVARQNGKTELLVILSLYWLYVERVRMVLGTSTNLAYAHESWDKAVTLAESTPALAAEIPPNGVRRANGEQALSTVWGGRYKIAASNRRGGRSLTIDRLVMDELREHDSWDAYNAAVPATNAVADAQVWMISNQGDDRSEVLNTLRDQAIEGLDDRLGVFEWSSPEGMEATDPEALAMANPNLGRRIDLDALMGDAKRAQAKGGMQLASFLTEVHCRRVPLLDPAIDMEAWAACRDDVGLDALRDRVALCVDVSLDEMHATIYAAAVDGERVRVDAVMAWDGRNAVRDMTMQLPAIVERVKPRKLGWFPYGPAAVATAALTNRPGWPPPGVEVEAIRNNITAVCMGFAEQVRSGALSHTGDPLLEAHLRAAEKLTHGDGWRFGRRGAGAIDAAYAVAGAVHLARTMADDPAPSVYWFGG